MDRRFAAVWVAAAVSLASAGRVSAGSPVVGSTVEVREGDTWTAVKVLGVEGNGVRVRYDDGTEETVGPDRVRSAGDAEPKPAARPPAATPRHAIGVGDSVEYKCFFGWKPGRVVQVTKPWLVVAEGDGDDAHGQGRRHWVEPWAVRVAGSDYELDGDGSKAQDAMPGQMAPRDRPLPPQKSVGDRLAAAAGGKAVTVQGLDRDLEPVSYANAHDPQPAAGDAARPLRLPTTRPGPDFAAWAVRGGENRLSAVLPCAGDFKTAVAAFPGSFGKFTGIVRLNLRGHGQLDTRQIAVPGLRPRAAAAEGDTLLTTTFFARGLAVWRWDGRAYQLSADLRPGRGDERVTAALLPTPERAVVALAGTSDEAGQTVLIDLKTKTALATVVTAKDATPYLHPSGQVVGVLTPDKALLLRPDDFAVLAEFPDAAGIGNVTVDPAGTAAAYLTAAGTARVVRIADGQTLGTVTLGTAFRGRLDLVDDHTLLVAGHTVYDTTAGVPVWCYRTHENTSVEPVYGGQFLLAEPGEKMASVAVATLPDAAGRTAGRTAATAAFLLKPGTPVKVDGDFGPFGTDREAAEAKWRQMVQGAGLVVSDADTPFHLALAVAAGPGEKRDYAPDMSAGPFRKTETMDVPSTLMTATLTQNGTAVWSQQLKLVAGDWVQGKKGRSWQDEINEAARASADKLDRFTLPNFLPAGAKPGTPAALGTSVLGPSGFGPEQSRTKSPGRHQ